MTNTPTVEQIDLERLERVERQLATGNGSYEAPDGRIMLRVWATDLATVTKLARAALRSITAEPGEMK